MCMTQLDECLLHASGTYTYAEESYICEELDRLC